ncbi:hypothetical protein CBFG_04840 [Clostridiales bacterium 1_7_47FAA]|nr:hypothetical protein CBFG_04840 [Clostridiales bacterium 1_7_47FAA]
MVAGSVNLGSLCLIDIVKSSLNKINGYSDFIQARRNNWYLFKHVKII